MSRADQDGSCWFPMRSGSETPRCCAAGERRAARGRNAAGLRAPGAPCCRSRGDEPVISVVTPAEHSTDRGWGKPSELEHSPGDAQGPSRAAAPHSHRSPRPAAREPFQVCRRGEARTSPAVTQGAAAHEGERRRLRPRRTPRAGSAARAPGQPLTLAEPLGDYSSRISYKCFWREKSKYRERCSLSAAPDGAAELTRTRLKPRDVAGHSQRAAEGERFSLALIIPLQSSVWARGGIRAS